MQQRESGRSMIEMIGVLAIIGVLSVGGIWGLNKAFTKHKVNNLMEDVKLAGFIVVDEMFETLPEEETSLAGRFTPSSGYSFVAFKESDVTFAIETSQISKEVCLETGKRKVDWLEEIRPNGLENTCKEGENFITFFFNAQLNTEEADFFGSCEEDSDCGECGTCDGRKCKFNNDKRVKSSDHCEICPTRNKTIQGSTQESCLQCKETYFAKGYKTCNGCDVNLAGAVTKTGCLHCINKYWIGGYVNENSQGQCYTCKGKVINDGTACDWDCPAGKYGGETKCNTCNANGVTNYSSLRSCRQCNNMFYGGYGGQNETKGTCIGCNTSGSSVNTRKADCLRCNTAGYKRYWKGTYVNENSLGTCSLCNGTVSSDGTQCITN